MLKKTATIILFLATGLILKAHPLNISVTTMDLSSGRDTLSAEIRVLRHDLATCLFHNFQFISDTAEGNLNAHTISKIKSYLPYALIISETGSDTLQMKFKDFSEEADYIIIKVLWILKSPVDSLKIVNAIFMDTFYNQRNLLLFSFRGKETGYEFDFGNHTQEINFLNH